MDEINPLAAKKFWDSHILLKYHRCYVNAWPKNSLRACENISRQLDRIRNYPLISIWMLENTSRSHCGHTNIGLFVSGSCILLATKCPPSSKNRRNVNSRNACSGCFPFSPIDGSFLDESSDAESRGSSS